MEGADAEALAFEAMIALPMLPRRRCPTAAHPVHSHGRGDGQGHRDRTEVIVRQAIEQFVLYTGVRPSPGQIVDATRFAHGGCRCPACASLWSWRLRQDRQDGDDSHPARDDRPVLQDLHRC
jgi:hypothetical protein